VKGLIHLPPEWRLSRRVVGVLALGLVACGGGEGEVPREDFDENAEAVRFVRSLREAFSQGKRPDFEEIQRLKELGARYPVEPYVENVLLAVLPQLQDWDGLAAYLSLKEPLGDRDRVRLTRVYFRQADYGGALRTIAPLAAREPQSVEPNALAGRASYFLGDNEAAARYYDRVWQGILDQGQVAEVANRAMIHLDVGELARAKELLVEALKQSPNSIQAHISLARVLSADGDAAGAAQHSTRVTELQRELSMDETRAMRRAAQTLALNEAWGREDFDGCLTLVYRALPAADEAFREELYRFLARMYQSVGQDAQIPAVLEAAREHARKGE
jgi:Flp pilus assembly protein TadD